MMRKTSLSSIAPLLLLLSLLLVTMAVACSSGSKTPNVLGNNAGASTVSLQTGPTLSTPDLVEQLRPSVVHILTTSASLSSASQGQGGVGTGIIINSNGFIVTNNHVVVQPNSCDTAAQRITVTLSDNREFTARIVGRDVATDLAVIKIDASGLPAAQLGDSTQMRIGDDVVAIGNALDLPGGPTVTKGVVSAKDRLIEETECGVSIPGAIQTDASINPGNSGGPLVDMQGRVEGITTAIISGSQGVGFAISTATAKPVVQQLIDTGQVQRAFLGVQGVANVTASVAATFNLSTKQGVIFQAVSQGGPASNAGLRQGDVIIKIGDRDIKNTGDLFAALAEHKAGDKVKLSYYRGSDQREVDVTLASRPS